MYYNTWCIQYIPAGRSEFIPTYFSKEEQITFPLISAEIEGLETNKELVIHLLERKNSRPLLILAYEILIQYIRLYTFPMSVPLQLNSIQNQFPHLMYSFLAFAARLSLICIYLFSVTNFLLYFSGNFKKLTFSYIAYSFLIPLYNWVARRHIYQ